LNRCEILQKGRRFKGKTFGTLMNQEFAAM